MGSVCYSDKYKELKQKYGVQLVTITVNQKGKAFLDRLIAKLTLQIQQKITDNQSMALMFLNEKQTSVDKFYEKVLKHFDRKQLGGISSYENLTNKKISNSLGYDFIKNSFIDLRENIKEKYQESKNQFIQQLSHLKAEQQKNLGFQESTKKFNQDFPQNQRQFIFKKGQMQYHDLIMQYQEHLLYIYGNKLKIQYYSEKINNIQYRQIIENMTLIFKDKLVTNLNLILGQKSNSYINIQQIQNIAQITQK